MKIQSLSAGQRYGLVLLRLFIGWHFLYEGILKLYNPSWTAKGYLVSASVLKGFFNWLADPARISALDALNIAALVGVGASLIIGLKVRWACIGGIALLLLYYLAHPPFPNLPQGPSEGSYWIVNKNVIEMAALYVIYQFPTTSYFGIENLFSRKKEISVE